MLGSHSSLFAHKTFSSAPHLIYLSTRFWQWPYSNSPPFPCFCPMFGMLFCVTGFLGLPFLWMSPKFSDSEKMVWSVVVVIYTLILIGITMAICWWSYSQISQILAY